MFLKIAMPTAFISNQEWELQKFDDVQTSIKNYALPLIQVIYTVPFVGHATAPRFNVHNTATIETVQ